MDLEICVNKLKELEETSKIIPSSFLYKEYIQMSEYVYKIKNKEDIQLKRLMVTNLFNWIIHYESMITIMIYNREKFTKEQKKEYSEMVEDSKQYWNGVIEQAQLKQELEYSVQKREQLLANGSHLLRFP